MRSLTNGPIVGATSDTAVTIWARADGAAQLEVQLTAPVGAAAPPPGQTALTAATDFCGVVSFTGLTPATTYTYEVRLSGTPQTLPGTEPAAFTTFPPANSPADVSFAFGSCFVPRSYGDTVFASLSRLRQAHDLRFFMMIGDNVYLDDYVLKQRPHLTNATLRPRPAPPPVGRIVPLFREAYQDTWAFENFRAALQSLPTFMIFDDHEFWNNWGQTAGQHNDEGVPAALQVYREYQDSHNPDAAQRHSLPDPRYEYTFEYGDLGFYVMDCRSRRQPAGLPFPTMLGEEQRAAFFDWLKTNNDRYRAKFVISSVPVSFIALPHRLVSLLNGTLGDQWLGYRQERAEMFKFIQQENITGVHFLSGDIHLGQGIRFSPVAKEGPPVYAYTASPLAQTIWLLGDDLPAWSSRATGLVLGLIVGLVASAYLLESAGFVMRWLAAPALLGLLGLWLGMLAQKLAPPRLASALRRLVGLIVFYPVKAFAQFYYLLQIRRVSADVIEDEWANKELYRVHNLFRLVTEINVGLVHVRQADGKTTVQFELYDEQGRRLRQEKAHTV